MSPQVLGQALVGRVRLGREDQLGQPVFQAAATHGQAVPADLLRRMTVAQIQASPEQLGHPTRKADGSPGRSRRHLVGAPQQVVEALLVPRVLELVVRRPTVVDHGAAVVEPENGLGDLLGGWRLAVGLGAVVLARLAPGSLGACLGRALGEGSCLALAGAGGLVELAAGPLVLGL